MSVNESEQKRKKVKKKKKIDKKTKGKTNGTGDKIRKESHKKKTGSNKSKKASSSKKASRNQKNQARVNEAGRQPVSTKSKVISVISNVIFYVVLIAVIAGAGLVYLGDKDANIMGYKIMTVLTDSMKPNKETKYKNGFAKGSLIVVKDQDPYELKKGDIITFNPVRDNKSVYLTHRVVKVDSELKEKREAFITTKGDANNGTDVPIGASQVKGKVVRSIPNAGYVLSFLKKHIVVVAILLSTLFGIVITLKYLRAVY